jgi:hypothetical protein
MAKTMTSISVKSNVSALKVYPLPGTKRSIDGLATVALVFDKKQAIELATCLLVASKEWDKIAVTGFRLKPRKSDGHFIVTVTAPRPSLKKVTATLAKTKK